MLFSVVLFGKRSLQVSAANEKTNNIFQMLLNKSLSVKRHCQADFFLANQRSLNQIDDLHVEVEI